MAERPGLAGSLASAIAEHGAPAVVDALREQVATIHVAGDRLSRALA